ncbi:hypothetical protein IJ135_01645 [Candidatus Saccharibacteria bacterium]|nr:hypothetical protein [Candidatus Saccharibacteria bacterium]
MEQKSKNTVNWLMLAGLLLMVGAVVLILIFFMQGETTVSGDFPEPQSSESIACEATNVAYPFFKEDEATSKTLKINMMMSRDKLSSISLNYTLNYATEKEASSSEAVNHAALNLSTQGEGLGADIFGAHYSVGTSSLKFGLYAHADDITEKSAKYLMLEDYPSTGYTKNYLTQNYAAKGLKCVVND